MKTERLFCLDIAGVAAQILNGSIEMLDGCRTIVRMRKGLSESHASDPDLIVFAVVESELDDVPPASMAHLWDPAAFAAKQREKDEYLAAVRENVLRACSSLVAKWGDSSSEME